MTGKTEFGCALFDYWVKHHSAPYAFYMNVDMWSKSMNADVDSDGRPLFQKLFSRISRTPPNKEGAINGLIEYGLTAFGFDESGEISDRIHYPVIRDICFDPDCPEIGQKLLDGALNDLGSEARIYAFFHYFGMSACARHGKLHENDRHVEQLLLNNGFQVEHENIYYARTLTEADCHPESGLRLHWKALSPGDCREFAAAAGGQEVGWGQVHFLPQGDIAYLRWIYIDESRQHQGYGTACMHQLFAELYQEGIRRFDTDTALSNRIAQKYYEKTGFSNKGITRSYYTK